MTYVPVWERPDSPTQGMTAADMMAFYKRTAPLGDARFYREILDDLPENLSRALDDLIAAMEKKATINKDLRARLDQWKRSYWAWREATEGRGWLGPITEGDSGAVNQVRVQLDSEDEEAEREAARKVQELVERRAELLNRLARVEDLLPKYVTEAAHFGVRVREQWAIEGKCPNCGKKPGQGVWSCEICQAAREEEDRRKREEWERTYRSDTEEDAA